MERVIRITASVTGVPAKDITGPFTNRRVAHARHIAALIMRENGAGLEAIGYWLNRHHSTVCRTTNKIKEEPGPLVERQLAEVRKRMNRAYGVKGDA